jgi:hypothetical protein
LQYRPVLEGLEDRTLPSVSLSATRWTPIGPASITAGGERYSGRVAAIAADPTDPNTYYVAPAGGGVWKSINAGASWTPLTDQVTDGSGNPVPMFMGALAVAPNDPKVVYAGTGESNNSYDSFYGSGILKSTDGGASWTLLGNSIFGGQAIASIVVEPADSNTVYVADAGDAENGYDNGNIGVWKSTDGGATWSNTTSAIPNLDNQEGAFSDLVMDPTNDQVLYTAVGAYQGETANGIYKTTDGGATWTPAGNAPTGTALGRISLAITPDGSTLYAGIAGTGNAGSSTFGTLFEMLKSTDGGASWSVLSGTPNYMWSQGWYDNTLAVDPLHPSTVYAGGSYNGAGPGFIESTNGGATWTDIVSGANGVSIHTDDHAIAFDASDRLLDGNDGGIWRLDNPTVGAIQWTDLNSNLQTTQFMGIALDPSNMHTVYAGSQDNGTEKFAGSLKWRQVAGGDGGYVRVDFNNPNTVYHQFTGISLQRSDDGGKTWTDKLTGINLSDPADFYVPYVMDPSNSSRLMLGTNRVYETTDRGDTWTPISTPGSNGWNSSSPIDAIAISKSDPNTIYASTGGTAGEYGPDHHIFVTHNDGATWQQTDVPGYNDRFADLKVDPTNSMVAYAVRSLFTGGAGGHVFQTTNGGATWTDISGNLPDTPTNAFALDPRTGILYASTDIGVYASDDGGTTWVRLESGQSNASVFDMDLNTAENVLAAATHGRGASELTLAHYKLKPSTRAPMPNVPFTLTLTVLDSFNRPLTGYTGTVHFTSTDSMAVLPEDYTFTQADHSVHRFTVTLLAPGRRSVTAADTINTSVKGRVMLGVTTAETAVVLPSPEPSRPSVRKARSAHGPDLQAPAALQTVVAGNSPAGTDGPFTTAPVVGRDDTADWPAEDLGLTLLDRVFADL